MCESRSRKLRDTSCAYRRSSRAKTFRGSIQAFNTVKFRSLVNKRIPDLKLLIVGSPGWKYQPIVSAMGEPVDAAT